MPVSDLHNLSDIAIEIQRIAPHSVIDCGVGFGLYGALCRQIMDGQYGRCGASSWIGLINGIEVFRRYWGPCWFCYSKVMECDILEPVIAKYDLVLMIDVLEHFDASVGRELLHQIVVDNAHVIVSVPNGPMEQGETFGNPHEAHRWTFNGTEEFEPYNFKLIHQSVCTVVSIEGMKA